MMQLMCLVTSPLIGLVMDFRIKEVLQAAKDRERRPSRRESTSRRPGSVSGDSKRPSIISLTFFNGGDARKQSNGSITNGHAKRLDSNGDIEQGLTGMNGNGGISTKQRHPSTSSTASNDSMNPKPPMSLKIRKLYNSSYAFFITSVLIMFFGVTVLIPNLQIQVSITSMSSLHSVSHPLYFNLSCDRPNEVVPNSASHVMKNNDNLIFQLFILAVNISSPGKIVQYYSFKLAQLIFNIQGLAFA